MPAAGPAESGDRQAHPDHQGGEVMRHASGLQGVARDLRQNRKVGAHHGAAHHGRDEHQLVGRGVEADLDVAVGEAQQNGAAVVDHQDRQQRQRQRPGVGQELAAGGQAQPHVGEAEDAVVLQVPEIVADQGEREGQRVGGEQVDVARLADQQEQSGDLQQVDDQRGDGGPGHALVRLQDPDGAAGIDQDDDALDQQQGAGLPAARIEERDRRDDGVGRQAEQHLQAEHQGRDRRGLLRVGGDVALAHERQRPDLQEGRGRRAGPRSSSPGRSRPDRARGGCRRWRRCRSAGRCR